MPSAQQSTGTGCDLCHQHCRVKGHDMTLRVLGTGCDLYAISITVQGWDVTLMPSAQ
jgi:hypothetical protein